MFYTSTIPNFLKCTRETLVNRSIFGKKMRVKYVLLTLRETSATSAPMIDGFPKFSRASTHGTWTLGRCLQPTASSLQSTLLFFSLLSTLALFLCFLPDLDSRAETNFYLPVVSYHLKKKSTSQRNGAKHLVPASLTYGDSKK